MNCYKIINSENEIIGVEGVYITEVSDKYDDLHNCWYIAITFEEYTSICEKLNIPCDDFNIDNYFSEISYDELLAANAELEAENAALLFKLLTGEEFADV